ncbi:restriction endonuclease [Thermococcus sp. CX2]|uniref:restriction endonuclease n=1 Tax=Thermococcus sp. CX2 TaxID=163006 RepID=UPI0014397879|nr:restriction endonuclease [Thermococcus sp. CX2]NJE85784.1 restriction endonuclease [Thermococcus sp. CX2]
MVWTLDLIMLASEETLIENVIELLKRMGFRNYEKVASKKEWGIDVVAIRDDPISGTEKLVIAIHPKGLAASRDVNVFAGLVDKYKADKGILISIMGFTKDAKVLISREYRGRVIPWDGEKLVSLFNNYSIEPPSELIRMAETKKEKKVEESPLEEFELDAPLLYEFSADSVVKKVASFASSKYPIKAEEVELESLSVTLSSAYIFSWSVEGGDEKDKAVVFSSDKVVLRATSDEKLRVPITKTLLNDRSIIRATERNIEVPISPSEAVLILKSKASKDLNVPEGKVVIHERKKVYVPKVAELELKVGDNRARAEINLESGEIEFNISPLPDEYFVKKAENLVMDSIGDEPTEIGLKREKGKVKITGRTERFSFEVSFNEYTGRPHRMECLMSDEALNELLKTVYPNGQLLGLEKNKKLVIAEVLVEDGIAVLEVDLTRGSYAEVRKLPSPEDAYKNVKDVIEGNFPLRNLELKGYRVLEHKYLELNLESEDGKAIVKVDGATGDVLDYLIEIKPERAKEIVAGRYPNFTITSIEEADAEYIVSAEDEKHEVKIRVGKDGKFVKEIDRILKRGLAEKIAEEKAKEIDEEAVLKGIELHEHWEVEFAGGTKVGKFLLHRATGEILSQDVRFTEIAIEAMYREHIRKKYGEENPKTERLAHYKDKAYINLKLSGNDRFYYARIDTRTGRILSEDTVPIKGITSKLKRIQLESKYK